VEADIVAFTDDDVVVDPHWLTSIAEGFAAEADVACVTGLILPEQLNTPAQLLLHQYIGYGYYGFTQRVFDMGRNRPADPAFPLTVGKAGSGANMAFATRALRKQGGFDPALGIGTKTYAGDETAAFVRTVLRHQLVYQPAAIVWHRNHRDIAMSKEAFHLGISSGALLTSVMLHERTMWGHLLRCVPAGIAWIVGASSSRRRTQFVGRPREQARFQKLSMLYGPVRYLESRWRVRRLSGSRDEI
jgi:GT2 family glycosyltransferase